MQDLARFSQMEKKKWKMIDLATRTVENDQDRLAVKKQNIKIGKSLTFST